MPSWEEVEAAAPELAAAARTRFEGHHHHVLGTLRRDGSPRLSGTEVRFSGGELWLGSMPGARKARDLQRDGRFSLHTSSEDPPDWSGDARISGRTVEVGDRAEVERVLESPGSRAHLFRCEVTEVVVVSLNDEGNRLVITSWTPERGARRVERD